MAHLRLAADADDRSATDATSFIPDVQLKVCARRHVCAKAQRLPGWPRRDMERSHILHKPLHPHAVTASPPGMHGRLLQRCQRTLTAAPCHPPCRPLDPCCCHQRALEALLLPCQTAAMQRWQIEMSSTTSAGSRQRCTRCPRGRRSVHGLGLTRLGLAPSTGSAPPPHTPRRQAAELGSPVGLRVIALMNRPLPARCLQLAVCVSTCVVYPCAPLVCAIQTGQPVRHGQSCNDSRRGRQVCQLSTCCCTRHTAAS
jgi:hypothetical protein